MESDKSSTKILKIFIIGSILYTFLHYYLYSISNNNFINMYRSYLYYIIILDLFYFLYTHFNISTTPRIKHTNNSPFVQINHSDKDIDSLTDPLIDLQSNNNLKPDNNLNPDNELSDNIPLYNNNTP